MFYVILKDKDNRIEFKFATFSGAIDFMQFIYPYLDIKYTMDMVQVEINEEA